MSQISLRHVIHPEAPRAVRGALRAFSRIPKKYFLEPVRSLARVPEVISRLVEIDGRLREVDHRVSKLNHDLRAPAPPPDEFSQAGTDLVGKNVLSLKQSWPQTSSAFSGAIVCNTAAPVPPLTSRARIQGAKCVKDHPEDHHFLNTGVNDLRVVFNIAGVYGVKTEQPISVLDFGVGCARMARHLPAAARAGLVGVDVDPVNIGWCSENMPFGRYEAILPGSTIPAEDGQFDLIYSHSVFTHLSQSEQNHWLKELGRVSRGAIILSVHGMYSSFLIANWSREPKVLSAWLKEGFVDAGVPNPDIRDVVDPEYYRDVAHTPSYIREHWSNYLDVVEIIPGGFGNVHDAIVLRRKGGK